MKKQAIEEALALLTVAGYSFFDKPFKALKEEEKRLENEQRWMTHLPHIITQWKVITHLSRGMNLLVL